MVLHVTIPWSALCFQPPVHTPSKIVADLMEATDDPRLDYYLNALGESYTPGDETIAKTVDDARVMKYQPAWYLFGSQPINIMSSSDSILQGETFNMRSNH